MHLAVFRVSLQVAEMRICRSGHQTVAEIAFLDAGQRKVLRLSNPNPIRALVDLYQGYDFLEVFDRDTEDGFHRDFGRYRIEYFIDDPHSLDADAVELEDWGESATSFLLYPKVN